MKSPLGGAAYISASKTTHVYPIVCVVTTAGSVLIWSSGNFLKSCKWSTSLGIPNFVELQRGNIEFEEPEDQFDKVQSNETELVFKEIPKENLCFRLDLKAVSN